MNFAGRAPAQKPAKVKPDPNYLAAVRALPCCLCGLYGQTEAHHCKDRPAYDEQGLYERMPGMGQKSSDRDAIPLCAEHHRMFHLKREEFHRMFGPDYGYIGQTRAVLSDDEISF